MNIFSVEDIIEQKADEFIKKYGSNTRTVMIIKGLNYADYYILRMQEQQCNFYSLNVNYKKRFRKDFETFEACIREVIRCGLSILVFDDMEKFCLWYLTEGKRYSKKTYRIEEVVE